MDKRILFFIFLLFEGFGYTIKAQENRLQNLCEDKDLPDILNQWRKQPKPPKKIKSSSLILIPSISSNPTTGLAFGIAGQYVFKGKNPNNLYSSINGSANYTVKNQVLFQVKNNVFLKNDKIFLSGDWRFFIFSQPTYGLGTSSPEGGVLAYQFGVNGIETTHDSLVQPMSFNHIRFHQIISWRYRKSFLLGVGYNFDLIDKIVDLKLDLNRPLYTSHYVYSKKYGFNTESYTVSGFNLNLAYDTRDNQVNPYTGYFANINWRLSPEFMGSTRSANLLSIEYRSYHSLSKQTSRHLIGFWLLGNFSKDGQLPYLILPALGYDQRGRSGRGYTQGRFRGPNMLYSEAEYRFPISPCGGLFGGVLFANMTTASKPDKQEKLFNSFVPGYGFGLRMKVEKGSRTNLSVDFAFGKNAGGIYFGAAEVF